jgi:RNA polymerase sigma-70 factor (ECF subfamily)
MDHAQLASWFTKWRKPIRSWLRSRSIPPGDIDDVAQEVFLRVLRYSDDTLIENPQGYLFRIASNVANEWRERSRVRKPHDDEWLNELIDESDTPEDVHWRGRTVAKVTAALDALPNRQGVILLMHVNDGLTYKEIAKELGLTYRLVLRELTRAYAKLRIELFEER